MPEKTLFKSESKFTRAEIAQYLRSVADSLEAGRPITLKSGDQSVTMEPPERPTFEVKVEEEGKLGRPKEFSIEFELEWKEGDSASGGGGKLEIE